MQFVNNLLITYKNTMQKSITIISNSCNFAKDLKQ